MEASKEPRTEDLLTFLRIAQWFESGETLNSVAKRLAQSPSTVSLLLDRIAEAYREPPLFERRVGGGGGTALTQEGHDLLAAVRAHFRDLRSQQPRMVIACSHSLITNQILNRTLSDFASKHGDQIRVGLHLETKLRFNELLRKLQDHKVDVAILWGTEQRAVRNVSAVERKSLSEFPFDLVFVSHDSALIEEVDRLLNMLPPIELRGALFETKSKDAGSTALKTCVGRRRIATLGEDAQPLRAIFPGSDSIDDNEMIHVDTYDAALAVVRAKVADIALMPAIYPVLSRARELGQVFYSNPVSRLSLSVWYAEGSALRKSAHTFVEALERHLADFPRQRPTMIAVGIPLPRNLEDYRKLRYGYYVTVDPRKHQNVRGLPSFVWGWERLDWEPLSQDSPSVLRGRSKNCMQHTFQVKAERWEAAFVVKGTRLNDDTAPYDDDVPNWVSTFTLMSTQPFRLYGTWTGTESEIASVYAAVFSEDQLELKDVRMIQESIRFRSVLSAEDGLRLDEQPKRK